MKIYVFFSFFKVKDENGGRFPLQFSPLSSPRDSGSGHNGKYHGKYATTIVITEDDDNFDSGS